MLSASLVYRVRLSYGKTLADKDTAKQRETESQRETEQRQTEQVTIRQRLSQCPLFSDPGERK